MEGTMTSAERAARLQLVKDDEIERIVREERALAEGRRHGSWRWTPIGEELQFRSKALPTMRLDMLRSEAADLMRALGKALGEKPLPAFRVTKRQRAADKKSRKAWNKAHEIERSYALKQMAEEFKATGGW
jgi:hypothetical protein